jgi:tRNA pseudouridine55 synthase
VTAAASASGIVLVDKPQGWTSHDVVARMRRLANTRKVGHAGTLDPMATGLLVIGIGSSTRLLTYIVGTDKEYLATVRLGASTTTDDAEGELVARAQPSDVAAVTPGRITAAAARLTGDIQQVPSSVSAIKVDGKRAYARVRSGEDVTLQPRKVTVSAFDILDIVHVEENATIDVSVRVECSSGTYVRAIARDLGSDLGVGGHLTALRRTRVGPYRVADAAELDGLDVATRLMAPADAASTLLGSVRLTDQQAIDLGHGKKISAPDSVVDGATDGPLAAVAPDGRLVGLVEFHGGRGRVVVNFPADELHTGEGRR